MAREAKLFIATGVKGVGKTFATVQHCLEVVRGVPALRIPPRRVLIFDVNDEYGEIKNDQGQLIAQIKAIDPAHVRLFTVHPKVEIRRIRPIHTTGPKKGQRMLTDELLELLQKILGEFAGGVLLIEDINKYTGDSMPIDLTGAICTNRHISCDIIMHYQSVGRPLPKIWQNTNMVRYHRQNDAVVKSKSKLSNLQLFELAETIVNKEFFSGNIRFNVWIDIDRNKLIGNFTKEMFDAALDEYISFHYNELKPYLVQRDNNGKPVYTYPQAVEAFKQRLFTMYWGNPSGRAA